MSPEMQMAAGAGALVAGLLQRLARKGLLDEAEIADVFHVARQLLPAGAQAVGLGFLDMLASNTATLTDDPRPR